MRNQGLIDRQAAEQYNIACLSLPKYLTDEEESKLEDVLVWWLCFSGICTVLLSVVNSTRTGGCHTQEIICPCDSWLLGFFQVLPPKAHTWHSSSSATYIDNLSKYVTLMKQECLFTTLLLHKHPSAVGSREETQMTVLS